ncbi:ABC transporter ATP-binding protein [Cryobacterium sp. TMT2-4]|uniref:ABC transporter ATP-binding protein n=1 Tax=Cryobacterium sp. TMT2-4 TaxID=1259254 RepID=UPI00106B339F|nr:ABC transporter ATP-binding protein [Cryobacterium sp. TMT2-4]TFC69323.1 ABC transporter ATP-binding protein [Cryobacterium sp. TMT2-4]
MIRFENVEVSFGEKIAIPDLTLEIEQGEFFTLLGPSGCGKTTALRTLAGFIEPSRGEIYIDGKVATRLPSEKRSVGMVFQNYALFPSMSVWENIAFGLRVRKTRRAETALLVDEIAAQVELTEEQLAKNVSELSGGQQQRVAIARALVLKPRILLLDEPLSNLDAKLRVQLREQLKNLQRELGITTVYVTHDQEEALTMSDRIAVFNHGVVEQVGTPEEIYNRSGTEFVCTFVGAMNKLSGDVVHQLRQRGGTGLAPAKTSYLRLEKVSLQAPPGNTDAIRLDGVVAGRSYHGSHSTYTIDSHGSSIRALVPEGGGSALEPGSAARLYIDPSSILQY